MNKIIFYSFLLFILISSKNSDSFGKDILKLSIDNKANKQIVKDNDYLDLKLEIDKEQFSPNEDGIDDNVTFFMTIAKDKKWVLNISNLNDKEIIEDGSFSVDDLTKIISGIGTGKEQIIVWDGKSTNGYVLSHGYYTIELKVDNQIITRTVLLSAPERIVDMEITSGPSFNSDNRMNQIKNKLELLTSEPILEINKSEKILNSR